jgi:Phage portal protein
VRNPFKRRPAEQEITKAAAPADVSRKGMEYGIGPQGLREWTQQIGSSTQTDRRSLMQQLYESYLACPWSWACVNAVARTITAGGLVFDWDTDSGEGDQDQPEKPSEVLACERLFKFVNPREDIRQLTRSVIADLLVFGDAFIEVVWLAGFPVALYSLDCPSMNILADAHGAVTGYVQLTEYGQRAEFQSREVIHISLDSPRSGVFGVSPTQAALLPITVWLFTAACLKETFRKGNPVNIHADLPAAMSEPEVNRWTAMYMQRNVGPRNIGTPITTRGGGTVKELAQSRIEEFLHTLDQKRDEIICLMPGTKIITSTGLVNIEDVAVGSLVLTHVGRWRPVTHVMVNSVNKLVVEVVANGFDPLRATADHPVWAAEHRPTTGPKPDRKRGPQRFLGFQWVAAGELVARPRQSRCTNHALTLPGLDLSNSSGVLHCADYLTLGVRNAFTNNMTGSSWVTQCSWDDGNNIQHSSSRVYSIPSDIKLDHTLGRLLGLYLAEGHRINNSGVCWSFHQDEISYQHEVRDALAHVFGLENVSIKPAADGRKCVNVFVRSVFVAELFDCGKALNKHLPEWAWQGTAEFFDGVLSGWNDGDGATDTRNGRVGGDGSPRTRAGTKSETLAWQMRIIAVTLGLPASLSTVSCPTVPGREINGRVVRSNGPTYNVAWPLDARRSGTYQINDGVLTSPVRSVSPINQANLVYNLEVADDHSYVTTSGTVHNCAYGVPPAEAGVIESGNLGGGTGESQRKMFKINTCGPISTLVLEKFDFHLVREGFGITNWHLKFPEIDMRDSQVVEQIRDLRIRNGLWTLNRCRAEIGEPPVDGGDQPVLVDRQNLVLWRDMGAASTAGIAFKLKGTSLETGGEPGEDSDSDSPVTLRKTVPTPAPAEAPPPPIEAWRTPERSLRETYRGRLTRALKDLPR